MTGGEGNIENTLRWNQVRKGGFRREKRSVGGRGRHLKQITFVLETLRTLEVNETKIGILFTSLKIKPCPVTDQMLACPSDSFPSLKVSLAINSFNESARERFKQLVFIPAPHQSGPSSRFDQIRCSYAANSRLTFINLGITSILICNYRQTFHFENSSGNSLDTYYQKG